MSTITQIAEGIKEAFVAHFSAYVTSSLVQFHDLDALIAAMAQSTSDYAVYFEFGGMTRRTSEHFSGRDWELTYIGSFWIRFKGDGALLDTQYVAIVDLLRTFLASDPRLGGRVLYANINRVDLAEQTAIQEMPLYWIPFTIGVLDRVL